MHVCTDQTLFTIILNPMMRMASSMRASPFHALVNFVSKEGQGAAGKVFVGTGTMMLVSMHAGMLESMPLSKRGASDRDRKPTAIVHSHSGRIAVAVAVWHQPSTQSRILSSSCFSCPMRVRYLGNLHAPLQDGYDLGERCTDLNDQMEWCATLRQCIGLYHLLLMQHLQVYVSSTIWHHPLSPPFSTRYLQTSSRAGRLTIDMLHWK
jgi:hypothetical protein